MNYLARLNYIDYFDGRKRSHTNGVNSWLTFDKVQDILAEDSLNSIFSRLTIWFCLPKLGIYKKGKMRK